MPSTLSFKVSRSSPEGLLFSNNLGIQKKLFKQNLERMRANLLQLYPWEHACNREAIAVYIDYDVDL